ncbi:hypothetical protein AAG906_035107 [Vitis piasezkii]
MNVKTTFLNDDLEENIYIMQLDKFIATAQEHLVYLKNRKIVLSQATYINKLLVKYVMQDSKKGLLPFKHGVSLSQDQCPKMTMEKVCMKTVPYASIVGSLKYVMLYTKSNICFIVSDVFPTCFRASGSLLRLSLRKHDMM